MMSMEIGKKIIEKSSFSRRCLRFDTTSLSKLSRSHYPFSLSTREVGGALQGIWHRYFNNIDAICIAVDGNNLLSLCGGASLSCVTISDVLSREETRRIPVALIFTKVDDNTDSQSLNDTIGLSDMLFGLKQFHDVRSAYSSHPLHTVAIYTSAKTNSGFSDLVKWLSYISSIKV